MTNNNNLIDWTKLLSEFDKSGLSASRFAKEHGIKTTSMYWQLRKRRDADHSVSTAEEPAFIPVLTIPEISDLPTAQLTISVGAVSIQIEPGFNHQLLAEAVRVLTSVC